MIEEIKSLKDERIQLAKSLHSLKGRLSAGKFLIEGEEAIRWAVVSGIKIDFILISNQIKETGNNYSNINCYYLSDGLLKKVTNTNYLIPLVAVGNNKNEKPDSDFLVVLDNLQDFGNIGAIIRTCHAFGIDAIANTNTNIDLFQ